MSVILVMHSVGASGNERGVNSWHLEESGGMETSVTQCHGRRLESRAAIVHSALRALRALPVAIYIFFHKQVRANGCENLIVYRASPVALAPLPMVLVSSMDASRNSQYVSFIQMLALATLVKAHGRRWVVASLMYVVHFVAVLLAYFNLGSHDGAYLYIPCRNCLLEGL